MTEKGYSPTELQELLEQKKYRLLKETLSEMNEVDIASFIEDLDTERVLLVFRLLPKDLALDVFACLPIEHMEHIIDSIGDMELRDMIEDLYTDDVMDMLEELPATMVKRVIQTATPATRSIINQYLNYPENSAGSIMTAEYVALKKNMTVEQSLNYIRQHGVNKETIYTCYVTNIHRKLEGVITLKNLVMSPSNAIIADIMDEHVMKATTTEDPEDIAYRFNKYNLLSLPVVDHENRIVGIITVDDVMSVLEQETTEDFEKMAAMIPSEKPYLKTSVFTLAKNRILWLLVLMVSSMITGGILASYEEAFAVLPLLVSFIPMLTGTGGNAGSQSSTLIIRGMTLNEIRPKDIFKVVFKEFRVGLLCGIVLAAVNYIRLIIFYPGQELVCLTVVLSLLLTIIMAKCVGCMLPIGAKKLHLDPAIMAAPLISTIVDAFSLIIYFQIACALLHI